MPRTLRKLTDRQVKNAKGRQRIGDGGGLWLQVGPTGTKSWLFRFTRNGKAHAMGLGPYPDISLARAREKAAETRALLAEGLDPLVHRRELAREQQKAIGRTFEKVLDEFLAAKRHEWRNAKHATQWRNTLVQHAAPLMSRPVAEITTSDVRDVLLPIWTVKTETATRVRQRIESILDFASALGFRDGPNPARIKGNLESALPAASKIRKVRHHPALHWKDLPEFMGELVSQEGIAPLALQFTILTAARTSEVVNARWEEIDADNAVWAIPGERMKAGRPHRIPLSPQVAKIVEELELAGLSPTWLFPGMNPKRPLSTAGMSAVLKRMGRTDITVHGFRSTFRDWCAEATNFPRDLAEKALAHVLKDRTEAAYQRGDSLEKRRQLMGTWARYACGGRSET